MQSLTNSLEPALGLHPPAAHSARLNRRLPPELALLETLVRLKLAPPGQRREWARLALAQADPPLDEDRPAMRAWLGLALDESAAAPEDWAEEEDPTPSRRDLERLDEADHLHRLVHRLEGQGRRQRRLLEQELLLRSSLPEDWHFHRAKWLYLAMQGEQTGTLLSPLEAARRARAGGVLFHPDQLAGGSLRRWLVLRRAVEMLEPARWLRLLRLLEQGRPLDLVLPPGLWMHLRPWLAFLLGGRGLLILEHYAGSLPDSQPVVPGLGGLLILHSEGPLDARWEPWARQACEAGWQLCVVRQQAGPGWEFLNRLEAGPQATEWVRRHLMAREPSARLLPLREFVRQVERHYILDVLGLHNGVKSRACERLQISRQTLYTKLNQELEREGA